jgi:malonyl-CoA/methylmalonyl-CoA synthetase
MTVDDNDNVLPNYNIFNRLLRHATTRPELIAVQDPQLGRKTYTQLLTDVLSLRRGLKEVIEPQKLQGSFICILASGGYQHTVAYLTITALGAVAVPLRKYSGRICEISSLHGF